MMVTEHWHGHPLPLNYATFSRAPVGDLPTENKCQESRSFTLAIANRASPKHSQVPDATTLFLTLSKLNRAAG